VTGAVWTPELKEQFLKAKQEAESALPAIL